MLAVYFIHSKHIIEGLYRETIETQRKRNVHTTSFKYSSFVVVSGEASLMNPDRKDWHHSTPQPASKPVPLSTPPRSPLPTADYCSEKNNYLNSNGITGFVFNRKAFLGGYLVRVLMMRANI